MHKITKPWNISLIIALALFLVLLSMPLYSDESTAQTETEASRGENATQAAQETAVENPAEEKVESTEQSTTSPAPAKEAAAPAKSEHVIRAMLTTGIENREPVDEVVSIDKNQDRIYFFTEFSGLKGKLIKHRWEYKGEIKGEVNFNVGSNHWRCYSSKNLLPEWTGIWTVSVIDDKNNVLTETYFEVTE